MVLWYDAHVSSDIFADILTHYSERHGLAVEVFTNPDYTAHTHSPFLLHDMDHAVARIVQAIQHNERIAVYADFDADGIPGAVVLHDVFKKIGYENFEVYIPHRDKEGFGFHEDAVRTLAQRDVKLIITVDVGISGFAAVDVANALGVDVIITDHHIPDAQLPDAYAIVNPKKPNDEYPFKELCGAGVAFKLGCALLEKLRTSQGDSLLCTVPPEGWEKWLLDVVGIATIADMVPLVGENRVLARYGLLVLRKTRRPGLQALMRVTRVRQHHASEDDVGFFIAPRINAASRMDSPDTAFELLVSTDVAHAEALAKTLEQLNRKRKTAVASITKAANVRANEDAAIIVLGNPDWKPAFLGLAAQSLLQTHGKTTCLWGREANGTYKGSCRTVGDVSLPQMFEALGNTLLQYGGHDAAGGFSFNEHAVHTLREEFVRAHHDLRGSVVAKTETPAQTYPASLSIFNTQLLSVLEQCAPFGLHNEKPIFLVRAHIEAVRRFGKGDAHIECTLRDDAVSIRAIAFFYEATEPVVGSTCAIQGTCERDSFKGGVVLRIQSFVGS